MAESRSKFTIFFSLAIALFLFGCLQPVDDSNITGVIKKNETNVTDVPNVTGNETNVTVPVPCEDMITGKEECLIERAIRTLDISDCRPLAGSYYDRCILGLSNQSYAYCGQLLNDSAIDDCFLSVSPQFTLEVCGQIQNETKKDACKIGFVSSSCKTFTNESLRLMCDAREKNDRDICLKVDEQDLCYLRYATDKIDNSTCDKISAEGMRVGCYGLLDSGKTCIAITNPIIKDSCFETYAVEKPDCSFCQNVSDSIYRDSCFGKCAATAGDVSQCSKPELEINRDVCYNKFAQAEEDERVCNNIKYLALRRLCIEDVATATASPHKCDVIGETYGFGSGDISACYYKIIGLTEVSSANCGLMNVSDARDQCILSDVKRTKNTAFCGGIQQESLREFCMAIN